MRRALCCLLTLLLFGCAPLDDELGVAEGEILVCGRGPTVEGIDVSQWQGTIDWGAVGRSGIRFAIVRIGDGTGHDSTFARNWAGARDAGLLRGAYQFFRPASDPIAQADIVVAAVGRLGPGDLPVTIDVEAPSPGVAPGTYAARIHQWVDRVTAGTGRAPIVYTGRYYWDPYVASSDFVHLPLWHAQYTSAACPTINDRWSDWAFWQYTSTGSVSGISGNVDRNRFNGTYEELLSLAGGALCDAHCEGSVIVGADCGRGDCAAFGSRCVDDALGARCAFYACPDTGDSTVCVDENTIGNCRDGAISTGDCSAFGSRCTDVGGPARCAFYACPDVGDTTVCLDESTLGTCHDGAISTGDCSAFGARCSTAGGTPGHCASVFCSPAADVASPAHDTCLPDGRLVHCTDTGGLENTRDCPAGTACVVAGATASCVDPDAPPPPAMGASDAGPTPGTPPTGDGGARAADAGVTPSGRAPASHGGLSGGCSIGRAAALRHGSPAVAVALALALAVCTRRRRR